MQKIAAKTRDITEQLTGTDDAGIRKNYGLYQLVDLEFTYQGKIKLEIDDIKPHWSKAIEQARLFGYRREDLEATLKKLHALQPAPPQPKKKL